MVFLDEPRKCSCRKYATEEAARPGANLGSSSMRILSPLLHDEGSRCGIHGPYFQTLSDFRAKIRPDALVLPGKTACAQASKCRGFGVSAASGPKFPQKGPCQDINLMKNLISSLTSSVILGLATPFFRLR